MVAATTSSGRAMRVSSGTKWQATAWSGWAGSGAVSGGSVDTQTSGLPSRSRNQQRVWK